MNKQLRKLQVTAADIGHCLVCGGVDGNCSCVPVMGSALQPAEWPAFYDYRQSGNGKGAFDSLFCRHCRGVTVVGADINVVRCECGSILRHVYTDPVIPEPDYGVLEGISDLPKRALRKPQF